MKKYIGPLLSISTIGLLFYTLFDLKEQVRQIPQLKNQIETLENRCDSLHDELFNANVELGRHELTRDAVLSKYPNIYEKYNSYLSTQTE